MNINRNNYEEFFILYLDNELGREERRQVEEFVAQNADLKDELEILQQTTFTPETAIVFNAKDELMRSESTSITLSNYDEWLVLSADDELTMDQQQELEQFISKHPYIQKELSLYVQAKLQPDEKIVFPDKSTLYRKEEKVRTIRWWRVAAAAVLLLMAGATYLLINRNTDKQGSELVNKSIDNPNSTPDKIVIDKKKGNQSNKPVIANNAGQINTVKQPGNEIAVKSTVNKSKGTKRNVQLLPAKDDKLAVDVPSNQLPEESSVIALQPVDLNEKQNNGNDVTNLAKTAYSNRSATGDNTDATYAVLEEGSKNKKNRGLFRKAVRFFEKNTNINAADDDRLLVGGLAFKLK